MNLTRMFFSLLENKALIDKIENTNIQKLFNTY